MRIIPLDFARYTAASRAVRAVLREYAELDGVPASGDTDPVAMTTASLDEAYLDLTRHLEQRQTWPDEQRSYWPRSAPGAPPLVCR